jgi:phosphomannomutase
MENPSPSQRPFSGGDVEIKFGTDGWRGVIAREFTFDNLARVAQITMEYLRDEGLAEKGVVIGYDRRFLSREFAERTAEIAAGNGISVLFGEEYAPTPAVSWAVRSRGAGAGIMITASHNPARYNGFKIKEWFGGSARPSTTKLLEERLNACEGTGIAIREVPFQQAVAAGKVTLFDPREGYLRQLSSYVDLELIRNAGLKVAVDPMFGAGAGFFPILLPEAAEIHAGENPGFGGRPPEPTEENLGELAELVKREGFGVGLALDGDADRIGAVDETGEFFSSHRIFTVLLRHLYERKGYRGGVVKTVSTTRMIDLLCEKFGLELFETPIGFKHICELMLERPILMGGEESGGLGVINHIPERDGLLMGLLLLEAMAASGKGLRRLLEETMEEIGYFHYRRIDLHIDPEAKEGLLARLQGEEIPEIAGRRVSGTNFRDGFKFLFDDGSWLLIRPSGTEPVLRLYAEAGEAETVEALLSAAQGIAGIAP